MPEQSNAVKCGKCGLPLDFRESGVRHFGTFAAHEESRCTWLLQDRIRALAQKPIPEIPACAAIQLSDGVIISGHRHHNCLESMRLLGISFQARCSSVQGFMTTRGRFVERPEARELFLKAGMESACPSGLRASDLYSEDLY